MKKIFLVSLIVITLLILALTCYAGDLSNTILSGKRIRWLVPSTSIGGDSYGTADPVSRYLGEVLNFNVKVDAIGTRSFDELLKAKPDGTTIVQSHDMIFLGILFGAYSEDWNLENYRIGPRVAINPGACFAAHIDAPYNDLVELAQYLKDNPNETIRVPVEAGSTSNIAYTAYYNWVSDTYGKDVADRLRVVIFGSTSEKLQALWDGQCDIIFASIGSLEQYVLEGVENRLKLKWLAFLDEVEGYDSYTMAEQGITLDGKPFTFSKEFLIYLPKDIPQEVVDALDAGMEIVSKDEKFLAELGKRYFKCSFLPSEEAEEYIIAKRASMKKLIKNAPDLDKLTIVK